VSKNGFAVFCNVIKERTLRGNSDELKFEHSEHAAGMYKFIDTVQDTYRELGHLPNPSVKTIVNAVCTDSIRQILSTPTDKQQQILIIGYCHNSVSCMVTMPRKPFEKVSYFSLMILNVTDVELKADVSDFKTIVNVDIPLNLEGFFLNHNCDIPTPALLEYVAERMREEDKGK
jgi:hypothetical protein